MKAVPYIIVLVIALAQVGSAESIGNAHFTDINGKSTDLGQARMITFWSSGCAPCMKEINILPNIARQNTDLSIAIVSLKDAEHTRGRLTPMPKNVRVLVAQNESKAVLTAFGNDRMLALPYSVMLDKKGRVCRKYYGILSAGKVKEWREKC
ncbi:MAG: hypothetical protein R3E60_01755 [Alphaproteobacteria bacterium]